MDKISINLDGKGKRIGIVLARFNDNIGEGLLEACCAELQKLGVAESDIRVATVPGALEIPLILKTMANSKQYDALIAIGTIIRGETYHFEVVSNESARGITDVQLNSGMPIANAVLTTENRDQAMVRMEVKGVEAAQVAIEMVNLINAL